MTSYSTANSPNPDMPEVPEIRVCVESVFDEGLVVCYTDPTGLEYRGALLAFTPTHQRWLSVVKPTSRELANPLSYFHDHPYCNDNAYAKHVVSKIPSDILLNWSTLPSLLANSETNNLEEIATRQTLAEVPLSSKNDDMQLSMPQIRSATVLTDPVKEPRHRQRMYCPSVTGRTAKKIANSKICEVLSDNESSYHGKSHKKNHKKRKSIVPKVKRRQQSSSPCVVDSPRPRPNINLKNVSVPLTRHGYHSYPHPHTQLGLGTRLTVQLIDAPSLSVEPWDAFMAKPELLDQVATPHTLTPVTPSQTTPTTNIGKHERAEDKEHSKRKKKKRKMKKLDDVIATPQPPVVLVTGISPSVAKKLKKSVVQLGGQVTERGSDCTHIVLPRVTRTVKFLCGISVCQYIVTPAWIESSASTGGFVREEDYRLEDKDAMELFGMTVTTSLARARARKLLKGGVVFHSTQSVEPPHTPLKSIIECAGGELLNLSELRSRFGRRLERSSAALMIISTPEDLAAGLCSEFLTLGLSVYNAELVLTGILRQELNFSSNQLSPL